MQEEDKKRGLPCSERSEEQGCERGAARRELGGGPGLLPPGSGPTRLRPARLPPDSRAPSSAPPAAARIRTGRRRPSLPSTRLHLKTHTKPIVLAEP